MTNDERDKILKQILEEVGSISKQVPLMRKMLNDHNRTLYGGQRAGVVEDVNILKTTVKLKKDGAAMFISCMSAIGTVGMLIYIIVAQ